MWKNEGPGCFGRGLAIALFLLYGVAAFGAPVHGNDAPYASNADHDHGAMEMGETDHAHTYAAHAYGAVTPAASVVWSLLLASLAISGGLIWSARGSLPKTRITPTTVMG